MGRSIAGMNDIINYYAAKFSVTELTKEETIEYIKKAKKGDTEARDKIIAANIRAVGKIANRYASIGNTEDMLQNGIIGIMKAINRFDTNRDIKFLTYATQWIRKEITDGIEHEEMSCKVAHKVVSDHMKVTAARARAEGIHGEDVNDETLIRTECVTKKEIENANLFPNNIQSLDRHIAEDNLASFGTNISDNTYNPENIILSHERPNIKELLMILNDRERFVLTKHYNLDGKGKMTMKAIAELLGNISKERVRQIEAGALKKLRSPSIMKKLEDYL